MLFLGFILFAYVIGSIVMNIQLTNLWKIYGNKEGGAETTIHVMSQLWPLTLLLTFFITLFSIFLKKPPSDSK